MSCGKRVPVYDSSIANQNLLATNNQSYLFRPIRFSFTSKLSYPETRQITIIERDGGDIKFDY